MPVDRAPIEKMIDIATGYQPTEAPQVYEAFVVWVTKQVWGLKYAPTEVQKKVRLYEQAQKENRKA